MIELELTNAEARRGKIMISDTDHKKLNVLLKKYLRADGLAFRAFVRYRWCGAGTYTAKQTHKRYEHWSEKASEYLVDIANITGLDLDECEDMR